jgi:hypothetical protein
VKKFCEIGGSAELTVRFMRHKMMQTSNESSAQFLLSIIFIIHKSTIMPAERMLYKTPSERIKVSDEPALLVSQRLGSASSTPPDNPTLASLLCYANSPPLPFSQKLPKAPSTNTPGSSVNEDGSGKQRSLAVEPSWTGLSNLLKDYPSTAYEVELMVTALQTLYPQVAGPFINYPNGPFPEEKPYIVCRSHLINDAQNVQMVVENIKATGRLLDSSDEKYLHYILQSPFG